MENQLQIIDHSLSTHLNPKEVEIAKLIFHVNLLTSFPLADSQIEMWAQSINRLLPDLSLEKLQQVIDKMKMGEIEYDKNLGVQNIFLGIKSLTRPMVY